MSETVQEYTARLLALVGDQDPWQVLESTPVTLRGLAERSDPAALTKKPAPDKWSATEILAHLADAEIVGGWRFRSVLARDGAELQAYDQGVWASTFEYGRTNALESVALFETLRRANLRLLRAVDPALHQRSGRHEERGDESVVHLIRMYAGHDLNHLAQLERLLVRPHGS